MPRRISANLSTVSLGRGVGKVGLATHSMRASSRPNRSVFPFTSSGSAARGRAAVYGIFSGGACSSRDIFDGVCREHAQIGRSP